MNKILVTTLLLLSLNMFGKEWKELLNDYRSIIGEETYQLLVQQQQAFATGQAPAIADQRIKQIEIQESGEKIVDVNDKKHPRIVVMKEHVDKAHTYPEDIDPRSEGYSKMRKGVFDALERMLVKLDELAPAFGYEPGDLHIELFEGLRDLKTQKELFDTKVDAIVQKNPNMTKEEAYNETTKWVSPYIDNVPVHSTGAAIDIHLYSKKADAFCDMGRFNVGGSVAPGFSPDEKLSDEQCKNRLLLLAAATQAGLTPYVFEFWHFSYGDRYAAYWREADASKRSAKYGSV